MKKRILLLAACLMLICTQVFCEGAVEEEDYVIAQVGDSGYDVRIMLAACADLGYLENLPQDADIYLEEYAEGVKAMESALGFTADGVMHLREFLEIETLVCPGRQSAQVQKMLECLHDLLYLKENLPEPHDTYDSKYVKTVKNAEKALGLQADGILTASEQKQLTDQNKPPEDVGKVSAKYSNGKVSLSWSAVKGAVQYIIYRVDVNGGDDWTFSSDKNSYADESVLMGSGYVYKVRANSYAHTGGWSATVSVDVPITYRNLSLKELKEKGASLTHNERFVKFSNLKYRRGSTEGKNFILEVYQEVDGRTYNASLVMEEYASWSGESITNFRYRITTVSGSGYVDPSDSSRIILESVSYNYK